MISRKETILNGCCVFYDYVGLSTDTKPTATNGSTFYEMDTKALYMYDAQNGVWLQQ